MTKLKLLVSVSSAAALFVGGQRAPAQAAALDRQPTSQHGPESRTAPVQENPRGPTIYQLAVHPGSVPTPALKYQMLPETGEKTQGNSATAWMLAFEQLADVPASTFKSPDAPSGSDGGDYLSDCVDMSSEQFAARTQDVARLMGGLSGVFRSADVAARRDQCDWSLPLREEGFDLVLPHLNRARKLCNLLAIRARYRMSTGDWDGAAYALQTGFALANDLNQSGPLVQNLVSIAIASQQMKMVREWQRQPGAPNCYWAVAALPRPFSDFHAAMQSERSTVIASFPQLRKLHEGGLSAQDWQEFQQLQRHYLSQSRGAEGGLTSVALAVYLYPKAKQYLIRQGLEPAKIDQMPALQVLGEYEYGEYQRYSDDMMKWTYLPFWQAWDGMVRSEQALQQTMPHVNPLISIIPSVRHAYLAATKLDRQIAAGQTIESLRAYAAAHEGKVPVKLQELVDMPAPLDPITGQPFDYRVEPTPEGSAARITITCPSPAGAAPTDASQFQVTFLKS